jgi:hypothetical protein
MHCRQSRSCRSFLGRRFDRLCPRRHDSLAQTEPSPPPPEGGAGRGRVDFDCQIFSFSNISPISRTACSPPTTGFSSGSASRSPRSSSGLKAGSARLDHGQGHPRRLRCLSPSRSSLRNRDSQPRTPRRRSLRGLDRTSGHAAAGRSRALSLGDGVASLVGGDRSGRHDLADRLPSSVGRWWFTCWARTRAHLFSPGAVPGHRPGTPRGLRGAISAEPDGGLSSWLMSTTR